MNGTVISRKFTGAGVLGILFLIIGPALSGFAYIAIAGARATYGVHFDVSWVYLLGDIRLFLMTMTLPLLIVGRSYVVRQAEG
ncbi:MAG: hypothetical protein K5872_13400 [Rhizobiaceae bacterium]|nr:hypothetical protein [Rhizobiaceae bacterium]MCV0407216.1 hypothetical protein [Rhizobiaceae bacterium]